MPDDGTLSGHFGNNEGDDWWVSSEDLLRFWFSRKLPRDYSDEVPNDELIYAANVVDEVNTVLQYYILL
jgi:hypothetical protein